MFRQLNEVAAQPPVRKLSEEKKGAKFDVIGGKIVTTRYGPSVLLDLRNKKQQIFSVFLSKALTELIKNNQGRYERLFREDGGVQLTHQGNGKVKFNGPEDAEEPAVLVDSDSSEGES
ncbi:hypothetical protein QAD02_013978 [Eretmocerus hayati]|uniref:Uncharacterized protein n=2 Tax=Eretmocerus hayati TaxID=131215 RepID=A0ACC2NVH1_9HYME|nr:hypothetical protein QAD02_004837 [Eretmocerus hayati]KAJ8678191.1 hypothetical protein QAD02_013978 [Eretmocerus hayati]